VQRFASGKDGVALVAVASRFFVIGPAQTAGLFSFSVSF